MGHDIGGNAQLGENLVVTLEDLDGVPALLLLGHGMYGGLLNVGNGVLHGAGEGVHGDGPSAVGGPDGLLGGQHDAGALQSGDLHHLAAQLPGQLLGVDAVTVLLHHIHHVDGHHNGNAQLGELRGEVEVALQVGAVDDIQNGIGTLLDQVVTGYHLLQRVGGQGVDAGQVHDHHIVVLLQLALFLLHRDAGPVTNELIGAGESVEKGGLAAVGVTRQRDLDLFFHLTLLSVSEA